jgi:hypothetical protein
VRELLAQNGVAMSEGPDGLWVAPAQACGAAIGFFEQ